jgi:thiol-disulfide isomerase/thioredoxin
MRRTCLVAGILLALGSIPSRSGATPPTDGDDSKTSVAVRFAAIKAEYEAAGARANQAVDKVENEAEARKLYGKLLPDDVAYSRRMVELALTAPADPGSRDALVWVIDHPGRPDYGPFGDEFGRAAGLLVRHHGDDPLAVSIGLTIDNIVSPHRDALLYGFLATAKRHDSMGLARLALGQYLETKGKFAQGTREVKGRRKFKVQGVMGDDGKVADQEHELPFEDYAYILALREVDPETLRSKAERLYEEVAADYSDVPYTTPKLRQIEALAKEPNPTWNGKPLTEDERRQLAEIVARKKTLGQVAEGRLDEMRNLVVGKPAPEIDGVGFDGKPLKLSDYRGKVVALVFWGTWCGPCMAEVPRERDLVERLKGKPFAMLGINCDGDKQAAIKVMASERITWPNWHDGAPDTGPITRLYHVRGYPTVLVLDAGGVIRHKDLRGEAIDRAVAELLEELAAKSGPK